MDVLITAIIAATSLLLGVSSALVARRVFEARAGVAARSRAERLVQDAEAEGRRLVMEAKEESLRSRTAAENEIRDWRKDLQRAEDRVVHREEGLDRRERAIDTREQELGERERRTLEMAREAEALKDRQAQTLENIARLTVAEAKDQVTQRAEDEARHDIAKRYYELEQAMLASADEKAKMIISTAIQRLAADVVSETTTTLVPLPNDEMKGRLIGREGRNIRAIEAATGVDLIIDDTPQAVTISGFDPIRREVAKISVAKLVQDGRIHPARIEEVVEHAKGEVEQTIGRAGEQAVLDSGVRGLHPELIKLIGRLNYRYSYGENILQHSVEVSRIAGLLAGELGCDVRAARAGGLLHDIGKALTHESEATHTEIGDEIARRFGLPRIVRDAIVEHHDDQRGTPEAFIVAAADAISAARPGARSDSVEFYLKRLEALEDVANSFAGVERSYAIQAGREVRIMVMPDEVDDVEAANLARSVVKKIEENLVYPGHIKVTVVRETRATEVAR